MARAREAILAHGGAGTANVFTRILLALFGELSWDARADHAGRADPAAALVSRSISPGCRYWARTVIVPLLVLAALQPRARNPRGIRIQELFAHDRHGDRRKARAASETRLGAVLQRARPRAEGRRAVLAEVAAPPRHRALRGLRDRAAERRGRAGRDLSRHGQQRDDVRRAGLPAGASRPRHRPPRGREAAGDQATTRPIASPASRRCGIPRWPPMP